MKELKKQRRIRDKMRMKDRAKKICLIQLDGKYVPDCGRYRDALSKYVKHSDYLAVCSCVYCGNPRKIRGRDNRTMQEIKFDLRLHDY